MRKRKLAMLVAALMVTTAVLSQPLMVRSAAEHVARWVGLADLGTSRPVGLMLYQFSPAIDAIRCDDTGVYSGYARFGEAGRDGIRRTYRVESTDLINWHILGTPSGVYLNGYHFWKDMDGSRSLRSLERTDANGNRQRLDIPFFVEEIWEDSAYRYGAPTLRFHDGYMTLAIAEPLFLPHAASDLPAPSPRTLRSEDGIMWREVDSEYHFIPLSAGSSTDHTALRRIEVNHEWRGVPWGEVPPISGVRLSRGVGYELDWRGQERTVWETETMEALTIWWGNEIIISFPAAPLAISVTPGQQRLVNEVGRTASFGITIENVPAFPVINLAALPDPTNPVNISIGDLPPGIEASGYVTYEDNGIGRGTLVLTITQPVGKLYFDALVAGFANNPGVPGSNPE